ncbi:tripartite tricarboxylate transporter TctB family protein [Aurantimonas sp. HBX-1]|uniref:tripartite tricarboxylate transporter TctB family protein n=1 Tax=Aurantimonas sp. HBX-1 TaxID=2906072 RepID=UPI001F3CF01D|nr:tripartite tricarboxylate transporter TctB family protein [Aurantimonas sp. HBX-1]UIJ73441.1 tripartite tricarboxylate transporter TctB family protein [Aurantimonas sp. HBX-1]
MEKILREKDLLAGAAFVVIGGFFAVGALDYGIGSARRMGPGYFPLALGSALMLVGLALAGKMVWQRSDNLVGTLYVRPVIALFAAILSFALLLETAGLVAACVATVLLSALGSRETKLLGSLVVALVMAAGCSLLFVEFLGLPMTLWRF